MFIDGQLCVGTDVVLTTGCGLGVHRVTLWGTDNISKYGTGVCVWVGGGRGGGRGLLLNKQLKNIYNKIKTKKRVH